MPAVLSRRVFAAWVPLALAGCATRPGDGGAPSALLLVDRPVLRMDVATRPSIDAFFARLRDDAGDAVATQWLAAVVAPAEGVLSQAFSEPVRFEHDVRPAERNVRLEYRQPAARAARAGEPAFEALRPLFAEPAPAEIRWRLVALATLAQQDDDGIRHDTALHLELQARAEGATRFEDAVPRARPEAVKAFSQALFTRIDRATGDWLRQAVGVGVSQGQAAGQTWGPAKLRARPAALRTVALRVWPPA